MGGKFTDDTIPVHMATIHPSALVTGNVELADDVLVGPHCLIDGTVGPVRLGAGCRLVAQCHVTGPTTLGKGNTLWPGAVLGTPPQDVSFDHFEAGAGLDIGTDNVFREHVTVHRSKTDQPTRIGNNCYLMTSVHIGHDCQLGDGIIMASSAALGGHTVLEDRVNLGGGAIVHQNILVGNGAMMAGLAGLSCDLPPWCMVSTTNRVVTQNIIGLRRSGASDEQIAAHRSMFKLIYRAGHTMPVLRVKVKERVDAGDLVAPQYATWFDASTKPICPGPARKGLRRSGR